MGGVRRTSAPVAQLDRASVYGTEGREFESLRARYRSPANAGLLLVSDGAAASQSTSGNRGGQRRAFWDFFFEGALVSLRRCPLGFICGMRYVFPT
jgi:hypothetical protein